MEWSRQNDVLLCTEIRVREPYKVKKCSNERCKIWTETGSTLNSNEEVKFHASRSNSGVKLTMQRVWKRQVGRLIFVVKN